MLFVTIFDTKISKYRCDWLKDLLFKEGNYMSFGRNIHLILVEIQVNESNDKSKEKEAFLFFSFLFNLINEKMFESKMKSWLK